MNFRIKLALAEDNIILRMFMKTLIEKSNKYEILFISKNGFELLNAIESSPSLPDVCILDVNMPVMNGNETAKEITERFPTIKLFVYSSGIFHQEITVLKQNGVIKVFDKSNPTSMINEIARYLKDGFLLS